MTQLYLKHILEHDCDTIEDNKYSKFFHHVLFVNKIRIIVIIRRKCRNKYYYSKYITNTLQKGNMQNVVHALNKMNVAIKLGYFASFLFDL